MIEVKDISKKYKRRVALENVSLQFHTGIYGLLGPNGAGKTTLMRILAAVLEFDSGEVLIDGQKVRQEALRSHIGYLPQKFSFYKGLTVEESLRHVAYMKNLKSEEIKFAVEQTLQEVNLTERRKERVGSLSGGMLRRLGIAQAVLGEPELLLADEPTVGLDPEERQRFRHLLSKISKDRAVLISTHIVEDVELISDNIIIMSEGRVLAQGACDHVLDDIKIKTNRSAEPTLTDAYLYYLGCGEDNETFTAI